MDPLTLSIGIVALISSAANLTNSISRDISRLKNVERKIRDQVSEIEVMCDVLMECNEIIQASQDTKIPISVKRSFDFCEMRYQELMEFMPKTPPLKSRSTVSKFVWRSKQLHTEKERKTALSGFRNAVLLLRDLCSDIRVRKQLLDMSTGVIGLMADFSDQQDMDEKSSVQPNHIYFGDEDDRSTAESLHNTIPATQKDAAKKARSVGTALQDLIKQDFTRNATIVVDNGTGTLPERLQYAHVRAKMDTGCNDNLITMDLIQKAGIDKSMLSNIPDDEAIELHGLNNAKCIVLYAIDLTWYQDGDMKMRQSKFYVVEDGPFDMLLGSRRFAQELAAGESPALILTKRRKKKAEREREKLEHERHLRQEQDDEVREREKNASSLPSPQSNQAISQI